MNNLSFEQQLKRCQDALDTFNQCIRKRNWARLEVNGNAINREMKQLQLLFAKAPDLDVEMQNRMRYLEIKFRRVQRQLAAQMGAVQEDLVMLERGIRRADTIRATLHG
ncbi:MAG: hypothetical protein AUJ57_04515 [Zetaproteobacteria bacterium CG1_02_53_45]|nr:MAG: hypothetical protein AUJ57_04515 [Zetaproteobacteria bacterium CG1_02_53_45]